MYKKNYFSAVVISGYTYVERGQPLSLACNATGRDAPPHDVTWYKDGLKVESEEGEGVSIRKKLEPLVLVSYLDVRASRLSDRGDYVCRSSNGDHAAVTIYILDGELKHDPQEICGEVVGS